LKPYTVWSNRIHSLKYLRSKTLGCKLEATKSAWQKHKSFGFFELHSAGNSCTWRLLQFMYVTTVKIYIRDDCYNSCTWRLCYNSCTCRLLQFKYTTTVTIHVRDDCYNSFMWRLLQFMYVTTVTIHVQDDWYNSFTWRLLIFYQHYSYI